MIRLLLLSLLLSSCVYGPKAEKKDPLNYLNGENYETTAGGEANVAMVPVVKRKERQTHVSGQVVMGTGVAATPIQNLSVSLFDGKRKLVSTAMTDSGGHFNFAEELHNGLYVVKIADKKLKGETSFELKDYQLNDLVINAEQL